jgi:hypothetical protein
VTSLVDAPAGRHLAQFHRDADALTESAFVFLEAGLRQGNSVMVIAAAQRIEQLFDRLAAGKLHPKSLCDSGQLAVLDAAPVIEQCVVAGGAEWARFRGLLAPVLARLRLRGHGTRIYGELANLLWQNDQTEAAIQLEDFWNALAGSFSFTMYCGYVMDTHCEKAYAAPLEELGRTHSDILGTTDDQRFGEALDRASKELFGISLTQMAGVSRQDGARRFPSGQRAMLWVKRNLPMSTSQLAERARQFFTNGHV